MHWGFGLGAVVLALLSLRETHRDAGAAGRGLAWGGLALGLVGGLLNGWFTEGAPSLLPGAGRRRRAPLRREPAGHLLRADPVPRRPR